MRSPSVYRYALCICALLSLLLVGCEPPEVVIHIDDDLKQSAVQIDFIKVSRVQMATWLAKDIDEYFSTDDLFRRDARQRGELYSVYFNVPEKEFEQRIPPTHPVWQNFQFVPNRTEQVFDILVFVDIPLSSDSNPEVRKQVIPLSASAWPSNFFQRWILQQRGIDKLELTITRTGVRMNPSPVSGS